MTPEDALTYTERLHAVVDELAETVASRNPGRLSCRAGCSGCCVDDLTVFAVEAEVLRTRHPDLFTEEEPHPTGACALLDAEGRCRAYGARPYVCRTQGLPLRWLEEALEDGERVVYEARDICPLNAEGPPLEALDAEACWDVGPFEARLRAVQAAVEGSDAPRRVSLRSLFAKTQ